MNLSKTYYLAQAHGGGYLPADGVPTGTLNYQATTGWNRRHPTQLAHEHNQVRGDSFRRQLSWR
jgi:hypothetical protein